MENHFRYTYFTITFINSTIIFSSTRTVVIGSYIPREGLYVVTIDIVES